MIQYQNLQRRVPPRSLSEESEVVIFHHPSPQRFVTRPCDVATPVWVCEPELFASPLVSPSSGSVSHVSATPASRVPVTPVSVSGLDASPLDASPPPPKRLKRSWEACVDRPQL